MNGRPGIGWWKASSRREELGLWLLQVSMLLLIACGPGQELADPLVALERGRQIIQPLKKDLKSALESGLARGPAEAISVCRIEAPRIASEHSPAGVEVGRTSHRLRNPENAPRSWVRPLLDDYLSGAADLEPMALGLAGGRVGYVEPILVQPLCLACHGQTLAPSVADRIRELYPADQAVGFDAGDFRGVFWAEYPAP